MRFLMGYVCLGMCLGVGLWGQVTVNVPGTSVIQLAGQPAGTTSRNNARSAPAHSPVQVPVAIGAGQAYSVSVTGTVDNGGAEGRSSCNDSLIAEYSVARVDSKCGALVGVFLGDTTRPEPPSLDFTGDGREIPVLRPLLQQPFLVGGGLNSQGFRKAFVAPNGATRLYLSAVALPNSTGSFQVTVTPSALPEEPTNPVRVSAISVIQLAGQAAGASSSNNGRSAGLYSPAQVTTPLLAGQALRIVATGSVDTGGPDGRPTCNDSLIAEYSISRIDARCGALVGVFLADTTRTQPPALDFRGALRNTVRLEPLIQQPFLVGSGYTDSGELKQFVVPQGATRLYLSALSLDSSVGAYVATVSPDASSTPVISRNGVVRAAGFGTGSLSAGSIASLFGTSFSGNTVSASSVPLPRVLEQTRVYFGLRSAPLYFTSAGQVNAQIPWEFSQDPTVQAVVVRNGAASLPVPVALGAASPGIFLVRENAGVVVNAATGALVDNASGVRWGDAIVIYASGLGPVNANVQSGVPSSSTDLEPTRNIVDVLLTSGGQTVTAQTLFAGSAPGFIGVNQVNALIPRDVAAGVARLKLRVAGVESNEVAVLVQ